MGADVDVGRSPLSYVRQELDALEGVHGSMMTRINPGRDAILSAMDRADVVHIVAHGRASAKRGSFTGLQFGPSASKHTISVSDILSWPNALNAGVVVLSSCEVAMSQRSPGDNGVGVPQALLERGVASVIAPLWRLEDSDGTIETMVDIHKRLKGGTSAGEAVARAQQGAIRKGRPPEEWAGFVAFGYDEVSND